MHETITVLIVVCGVADAPSPSDNQKGAKGAAKCLLPWLQKLCAVPVLRTLIGDLLLQTAEGELRALQHYCIVCKVMALRPRLFQAQFALVCCHAVPALAIKDMLQG